MPSVGDRTLGIPRAGRRLRRALATALAGSLAPLPAPATDFRVGELEGIFDVSLTYGLLARVEGRDSDLIGIGNGGNAPSVNVDDGNLNYDRGIVANGLRATGELTLQWREFGAFVRGYGFYDFETELGDRDRTDLSGDAEDLVGSGGEIQDYYLTGRFKLRGIPVQLRLGNQVLNWGESGFLRFGVDVINPVDFVGRRRDSPPWAGSSRPTTSSAATGSISPWRASVSSPISARTWTPSSTCPRARWGSTPTS
jgi:hypothetical protein